MSSKSLSQDYSPVDVIQLPTANLLEVAEHFAELRDLVVEGRYSLENAHDKLMGLLRDYGQTSLSGAPLPADVGQVTEWTASVEQLYQNLLAGADFTAMALDQASKGSRAVLWPEKDFNWGLDALPSDPFRVVLSQDGLPMLMAPNGTQFNAPSKSTLGEPVSIGIILLAIATVGAYVAITYLGVQAIIEGLHAFNNLVNRVEEVIRHQQIYKCAQTQSAEECAKLTQVSDAGHSSTLEKEIAKLKAENDKLKAPADVLWAIAALGAVGVLGYGAYEYSKKPYSKR